MRQSQLGRARFVVADGHSLCPLGRMLALLLLAAASGCDAGRQVSQNAAPLPATAADAVAAAGNSQWPGWRGENCSGVAPDQPLPTTFSPRQGLRWEVPVPGAGNSSPVVWNDLVLLTSEIPAGAIKTLALLAFDRRDGRLLWQTECGPAHGGTHVKNGYASASPVTDGERVFASFGSAGLLACDMSGKELWRAPLGTLEHQWGTASSPVLFEGLVIQLCDSAQNSSIAAFEQSTGKEVWRTRRDSGGSWSTPVFVEATPDGSGTPRTEMVVNGTGTDGSLGYVIAYDPRTGAELWRVQGTSDIPCPSIVQVGGMVISMSGRNKTIMAIRPGGAGDVTESHVVWRLRRGGPYVPTGIAYRNRLYVLADGGLLTCFNPGNGDEIWHKRLKGTFTASLVAGGGQIYACSERGAIYVFAAAEEFRELETNDFDQAWLATPAISRGELFLRGEGQLYCVAAIAPAEPAAPPASAKAPSKVTESPEPTPQQPPPSPQESPAAQPADATPTADAPHDWPQWGGTPARNMVAHGAHDLPTTWDVSAGTNVVWSAKLGRVSYGNPVLAGGKLFVGTNNEEPRDPSAAGDRGVLMCFSEKDGSFLWQDSYEKLPTGEAQDWPLQGICSSPAVSGERVYYYNNRAQLVCADTEGFRDGENDGPFTDEPATGPEAADIVWRVDLIAELGISPHNMAASNPLLVGDRIFLVTSNGVNEEGEVAAPAAPSFAAFDKATGKILWHEGSVAGSQHQVRQTAILDGQWSSPAWGEVATANGVEPQVYFPGGDGWLYALNPETGALLWKFDGNPPEAKFLANGRGDRIYPVGTPVFSGNRVYFTLGQDPANGGGPGHFYCVDASGRGDVTATHAI
ncbi:MAG: PQQ-binding-like beta-propeller repeat protein, partial [Planctomycetaceae bacterium]|nr:PQQ-binding-like beta-propeller repeat protein [Planctomycetaceae bacterium]